MEGFIGEMPPSRADGAPHSFNEILAFRQARDARPVVEKYGGPPVVSFRKTTAPAPGSTPSVRTRLDGVLAQALGEFDGGGTARQVIERAITNLAKADYPDMNGSEGRITFLSTPDGEELGKLAFDADAGAMKLSDFLEKKLGEQREAAVAKRQPVTVAGTALTEINKRAEELRKQDPKLSPSEARLKVFDSDPELRRRYDEERAPEG